MATVALNIYTDAYPTITNNIEIRVYAQSNPLAIVASLNYPQPHPLRTWSFPGLPQTNYLFRIFEMSGTSIVRQLGGDMDVVPGSANGVNFRATEQIEADVTTGLTSGTNTFTFNGTAGTEDWRGWDISTIDRIGTGPMKRGVDFTWDKTTGIFVLLQGGDVFAPNEWFNVAFEAQTSQVTQSIPTIVPFFTSAKIVTANYSIAAGNDFGGLLIVDPPGDYIELTLPDIATVVDLRPVTIEMRKSLTNKCCKIITQSGQTIDWQQGRNDLYICPNESIKIYHFIDPSGPTSMWRVLDPQGNFLTVGQQIYDDNLIANMYNVLQFTGAQCDIFQFARLYNDYVIHLTGQLVNYDDWTTGNSKYCFSWANSANPANANKFMTPDRRDIVEKISDGIRLPGQIQAAQVGQFSATISIPQGNSFSGNPGGSWVPHVGRGDNNPTTMTVAQTFNTGNENLIKTVATRKYCYV